MTCIGLHKTTQEHRIAPEDFPVCWQIQTIWSGLVSSVTEWVNNMPQFYNLVIACLFGWSVHGLLSNVPCDLLVQLQGPSSQNDGKAHINWQLHRLQRSARFGHCIQLKQKERQIKTTAATTTKRFSVLHITSLGMISNAHRRINQ